jgi:hypothetical protein
MVPQHGAGLWIRLKYTIYINICVIHILDSLDYAYITEYILVLENERCKQCTVKIK